MFVCLKNSQRPIARNHYTTRENGAQRVIRRLVTKRNGRGIHTPRPPFVPMPSRVPFGLAYKQLQEEPTPTDQEANHRHDELPREAALLIRVIVRLAAAAQAGQF